MPRLLKLPQSPPAIHPKDRRLSMSRSTGDLMALSSAASESPINRAEHHLRHGKSSSFVHQDGKEKNKKKGLGTKWNTITPMVSLEFLPNPLESIVCGDLYRLSNFGIWCRLWMELRFSYMFFYYDRNDFFPADVIRLKNYRIVPKAPECDHLEGLFPFKIVSEEEQKIIFLYAESKECQLKWIAALFRASGQKPSRVIEGLNLAHKPSPLIGTNPSSTSFMNENDRNSWVSFVEQLKTEDDNELLNLSSLLKQSNQNQEQAFYNRESAIRNLYDRALEMTEHEALRRKTYFAQRRLSTQIKLKTLEEQLHKTVKKDDNVLLRLHDLQEHLESINSEIKETHRAAEETFHDLKTKKAETLKNLHSICPPSCSSPPPSEEEVRHKIAYISNEPKIPEIKPVRRLQNRVGGKAYRPQTFSPGDWTRNPKGENPMTAMFVEGLRKSESVNDLGHIHEKHSKRLISFLKFSKPGKDLKRTKSVEAFPPTTSCPLPPSPKSPTSPSVKRESKGRRFLRSLSHQDAHLSPPESPSSSVFYTGERSPSSPKSPTKAVFSIEPTEYQETVEPIPLLVKTDPEGKETIYHFHNASDSNEQEVNAHHHHRGSKVGKKILRILSLKGRKKDHNLPTP